MTHSTQIQLAVYDDAAALDRTADIVDLYGAVYAEPPYNEGPDDVRRFAESWPRRVRQPGFRLVVAESEHAPVGLAFGHQLMVDTRWWDGSQSPLLPDVTTEYPGRTFAIIELAVVAGERRQGVGRLLHEALLAGRGEERVTLLSLPDAAAAQHAYESWGYERLARIQPGPTAPVYDCFMRRLPL
jgi:GNAT superfamily N-acetyltransferase